MKNTAEQITREPIAYKFVRIFGYVQLPVVIIGGFYCLFYELHKNQEARQRLHSLSPTALKFFYFTEDLISGGLLTGEKLKLADLNASDHSKMVRKSTLYSLTMISAMFTVGIFGRIVERYLDNMEMDPIPLPSWRLFVAKEQEAGRELTLPISN
uniref:Uncharacterized protein n=1 Tax=Globodera pallida TaxID=36090 RepID=A0A183C396_GLOPA